MRKLIVIIVSSVASAVLLGGASLANAEFKFGVKEVQCSASPNQPNCPGSH
jgi:hypothetical protein